MSRQRESHDAAPPAPREPLEITDEVLERARERGPKRKRNREPRAPLTRG